MDRPVPKMPAHESVYQRLRGMILFGELAPGQAVTILGLTERLGAGQTPVREALRRLTAEGALQPLGNRRVCVPRLDALVVEELSFARLALEPKLAEMAFKHLTGNTIDAIDRCDDRVNLALARGDVADYLRGNHDFHMRLYSLARAPLLMSLVGTLWLRVGPSLRVVCGRLGTMNITDQHEAALVAMRAGDADALAQAIAEDIRQGMRFISQSLHEEKI